MSKVESVNGLSETTTVIDVESPPSAVKTWQMSDAAHVVSVARKTFEMGKTRPIKFRKAQLKNLARFFEENVELLVEAMWKDLRKPRQEVLCYDIAPAVNEIRNMLMNVDSWAKPQKPCKAIVNALDDLYIYSDPYGVVLVMGAWNYPIQLTISPLAGAIAAGNTVIIKPSDLSPATSQVFADIIPKYLDKDCYPVFLGGIPETTVLLKEKFDYIFYTGSTMVGKIVHLAANKNLTPTTLELGGKSPVYIDNTADIEKTVRRILWGKFINAGQTCIAPDYILCTKHVQEKFVQYASKVLNEFYPGDVKSSPDFCRIITDRHFDRLVALMTGLKFAIGGQSDASQKFIEPSIAVDVDPLAPVMQEEIFGPILPIVTIRDLEEAIDFINEREKPLALYIFTKDSRVKQQLLTRTSSGGGVVNDVLLHVATEGLPFGGVGFSGMGNYHGKASFDTFTHKKSILMRGFSAVSEKALMVRYAPYSPGKTSFMLMGMKHRRGMWCKYLPHLLFFVLGVLITVLIYQCQK